MVNIWNDGQFPHKFEVKFLVACHTMTLAFLILQWNNVITIEQRAFENVNNCLNVNIVSYLNTSGGQNSNLYLNVFHFFNVSVIKTSVAA